MWSKIILVSLLISLTICAPTQDNNYYDRLLKPNTRENLEKLKNLGPEDLAEELSGQYQGDIVISPEEIQDLESSDPDKRAKTGLINEIYKWPNNLIPYRIQVANFDEEQIAYIHKGAERLMEVAPCLSFVPYDSAVHTDFITVRGTGSGCSSSVGRRGGEQFINLQPYPIEQGCFRLYTIVHEFLHALGFYHMQSAYDRDNFVRINFEFIQSGTQNNFNIYSNSVITHYNVEYDYGSCMHYSRYAFSVNQNETITPLRDLPEGVIMGQRTEISEKDIARLNRRYCGESTEIPITLPTTEASTIPESTPTTVLTSVLPPTPPPIPIFIGQVRTWANSLLTNILSSFTWN